MGAMLDFEHPLKQELTKIQVELKVAVGRYLCSQAVSPSKFPDPECEQRIRTIGCRQRELLGIIRRDLTKAEDPLTPIRDKIIEDKKGVLQAAVNKARKKYNTAQRAVESNASGSDESNGSRRDPSPPGLVATQPQDLSQCQFLNYFSLGTHDVYKDMLNKRAERRRRSTANPQYFYNSRSMDNGNGKRKRNGYMVGSVSPPHTRAKRRHMEKTSPPQKPSGGGAQRDTNEVAHASRQLDNKNGDDPPSINGVAEVMTTHKDAFPLLPNLPHGLVIQKVNQGQCSDAAVCVKCKKSDNLSKCEGCDNGFHNRPLAQAPRHCPFCIGKQPPKMVGRLSVPLGMSVSCTSSGSRTPPLAAHTG